jgi:quercetin dioxygenase-like cupin family protein
LAPEKHAHSDQEEAFYVISGELVIEVDGVTTTLPPRAFALVRRVLPHRHIGGRRTRLLAIFSPAHAFPHLFNKRLS